jgi:branched-chain amino acid transport system permease protein
VVLAQTFNGLALGALFMILSSGLAMIYGLRGVMNFAHGALYTVGAYVAYEFAKISSFWFALIAAPLVLAAIGALLELGIFRRLQDRDHMEVGLITFGLALMIEPVVSTIWGHETLVVSPPSVLEGSVSTLGVDYPAYRLFIIAIGAVLAVALVLWLKYSAIGLNVRAASHDTETAAILGVNVDRVSLMVVCVGSGLAGLAGVLAAPYFSVEPSMGHSILITVLVVVVVGGVGSIGGAMVAGLGLGLFQTVGSIWAPELAVLVPFAVLILILVWRPAGLAGKRVA